MSGKRASIAAGVAGLLAIGGLGAAAANAAAAPAAAPHWQIVKSVKGLTAFSAVVATGKTSGWAFEAPGHMTVAYERSGGAWTKQAFPSKPGERVDSASATSPSNVWVVTTLADRSSRVLRFDGHTWSAARVFTRLFNQVTVRAVNDVWLFGPAGVVHYNGKTWAQVGGPVVGGGVISDNNIWAFNHSNAYHWFGPGHLWTVTSLRSLLPPKLKSGLNLPEVVGMLALSPSNVYALGNGNAQDEGGPIAVLHYDGHKWSRVAEGGGGYDSELSADGHGGLWIPMPVGAGGTSFMLHYSGGKLTKTALPESAAIWTIARVPGTAQELAGGFVQSPSHPGLGGAAVVLQYS